MRTSSDPGRLHEVVRDFNRLWNSCSEGWQDESREHFLHQHIEPLQSSCDELLTHLAQLNQLLTTSMQRCQ